MKPRAAAIAILLPLLSFATIRADVTTSDFGKTRDGTTVQLFTLTNTTGSSIQIMTYGTTVVSLKMPDRSGKLDDIVLGFDTLDDYLRSSPFFGAVVGRYANRIHNATFTLDGTQYHLPPNDHGNTLHGGRRGFDKVLWTGNKIDDHSVEFTYLSKDGDQGFPGNLTAHVRYSLSDADQLTLDYSATTDKDTVINLTNHSYFNLAGAGNGDVLSHRLMIDADQITPADAHGIPTGKFQDVANTPFDFRTAHKIGDHIADDNDMLHFANGYDINFVLNKKDGLHLAATVYEPTTGRLVQITTTEPGVQLYTGNGLNPSMTGKDGKHYLPHGAFCLETQHFPDSPNQPDFPSTELKPGQTFHSTTTYQFSTDPRGPTPPGPGPVDLRTGWKPLQQGAAQGTIQQDARHPTNADPHLLEISVTKTAAPGEGRAGAVSDTTLPVTAGNFYDITFTAVTERGSIGLVFSLETADGKVLAATTLPEIGGRGRRRGPPPPPPPPRYK
jgi:aldose 1-epimerase